MHVGSTFSLTTVRGAGHDRAGETRMSVMRDLIVAPAYNEESALPQTVTGLKQVLPTGFEMGATGQAGRRLVPRRALLVCDGAGGGSVLQPGGCLVGREPNVPRPKQRSGSSSS
jgi:hypothetical protein